MYDYCEIKNKKRKGCVNMAKQITKVSVDSVEGLEVHGKARDFEMTLDEPTSMGGTDKGMNPVEALLISLGACKTIVARAFAKRERMNIKDISIELEGDLDPDGFLGKNPDAKVGFSEIRTKYHINADNTEEEIADFVDFIEKTCPVADTIVNTPSFKKEIQTK